MMSSVIEQLGMMNLIVVDQLKIMLYTQTLLSCIKPELNNTNTFSHTESGPRLIYRKKSAEIYNGDKF